MTIRKLSQVLIVALGTVLLTGTGAFAKGAHILNAYPATVNGQSIKPGHYDVEWQEHSPEATVTFSQDRHTVATVQGKVEERSTRYKEDAVIYDSGADGTKRIVEIQFAKSNKVLVFSD
jgi:hypothetical protein